MGFDGSSITGLQPDRGVGHDRDARPDAPSRCCPGAPRRTPPGGCSATSGRPAASPTRATRAGSCAAPSSAPRTWASTPTTSAPSSSTSTSRTRQPEGGIPEVLDDGGYFDLTTLDAGSDVRRETILALEQLGIHVEYAHHEVGPVPARGRHALQGRARDVRRLHDVPHRRQGVRDEVRLARHLHAEAALRRERLGDARAPVALEGRQERLLRRRRPVLPLADRQGVHRRPAASTRARSRRCSRSG